MIQWSNLTKCGLFSNISHAVHAQTSSIVLQRLDSFGIECSPPDPRKVINSKYDLIIGPILLPAARCCVFFNVGERKIVRWCQIRRIWRVIDQSPVSVKHISHCNHRLVCRSIVLVKQDSLRQFSKPSPKFL